MIPFFSLFSFSLLLRYLSINNEAHGYKYVFLFFITTLVLYFTSKNFKFSFKKYCLLITLAAIPLIGTEPLHENDQYRYIWEGKVLASGISPYLESPESKNLDFIDFPEREKIAYNKLSTIYPPISLVFFALSYKLTYKESLILFQVINLFLVIFFIFLLKSLHLNDQLLLAALPMLLKEYIQSIHIDLFAAIFFLIFLTSKNNRLQLLNFFLSFYTKLLSIISLPYKILREKERPFLYSMILLITGCLFTYFTPFRSGSLSGPQAFALDWRWNAGFYQLLLELTPLSHNNIKIISLSFFVLFYLFMLKKSRDIVEFSLYAFSALVFFAPVYNAWYGIWLLIPAILKNNKLVFIYALIPSISYLHYPVDDFTVLSSFITHIIFPIICISFFRIKKKKQGESF